MSDLTGETPRIQVDLANHGCRYWHLLCLALAYCVVGASCQDTHICDESKALTFKDAPEFVGRWHRKESWGFSNLVVEIHEVGAFGPEYYGCAVGKFPLVVGDYNVTNLSMNRTGGAFRLDGGFVRPSAFYFRWTLTSGHVRERWGELIEPGKMRYLDESGEVKVLYKKPVESEGESSTQVTSTDLNSTDGS